MKNFTLENFGPIFKADVNFGDLTILIGPQASGKSLYLEMLKLLVDREQILGVLKNYNYIVEKADSRNIIETYFGEGMGNIVTPKTMVQMNGKTIDSSNILKLIRTLCDETDLSERVFYIPAQRILSMDDGRTRNFMEFDISSPYVLRNFSEILRRFVQSGLKNPDIIFPIENRLKSQTTNEIRDSIFHNSRVILDKASGQRKMKLSIDTALIPFMAWSAGQKEFLPLLLSFYYLSQMSNDMTDVHNKIVIIEEPEMGLHPKAIQSVLLEVIDLLSEGYQIIISTHSSVILEFAWAFNEMQKAGIDAKDMITAMMGIFGMNINEAVPKSFEAMTKKKIKTYFFSPNDKGGNVETKDISTLDAGADDNSIAEWGGLSSFAGRAADAVLKIMGENI